MLTHIRRRIEAALAPVRWITLASSGPAGVQASRLPCEARRTRLYVLLPATSDHLFNLESQPEVVLVEETWQIEGRARILPADQRPAGLFEAHLPEALGDLVIEVQPDRFTFVRPGQWGASETLDLGE